MHMLLYYFNYLNCNKANTYMLSEQDLDSTSNISVMQKLRTHKIDRTNEYRRTCVVLILQRAHLAMVLLFLLLSLLLLLLLLFTELCEFLNLNYFIKCALILKLVVSEHYTWWDVCTLFYAYALCAAPLVCYFSWLLLSYIK